MTVAYTVKSDGTQWYVERISRDDLSVHPTFHEAMAERERLACGQPGSRVSSGDAGAHDASQDESGKVNPATNGSAQ